MMTMIDFFIDYRKTGETSRKFSIFFFIIDCVRLTGIAIDNAKIKKEKKKSSIRLHLLNANLGFLLYNSG